MSARLVMSVGFDSPHLHHSHHERGSNPSLVVYLHCKARQLFRSDPANAASSLASHSGR
jgi:hypothetical protein